ncbi:AAA family ATPase [Clostridium butyricum]|uniref:AAA family ATPase n=1 Tax=Clostridium butyricum TaxID=1492 RepID=UPI003D347720
MELIYIWVKNYGCFKDKEFNFNQVHQFRYKYKKNKLSYSKKSNNNSNIFNKKENNENGQLVNLTAIVGENGAGKSTLLNLIANCLPYRCLMVNLKILVAYKINDKIEFYSTFVRETILLDTVNNIDLFDYVSQKHVKVKKFYTPREVVVKDEKYDSNAVCNIEELKTTRFIYFTDIFENNAYMHKKYGMITDLSFSGLINKYFELRPNRRNAFSDKLINYINKNTESQINFICSYDNVKNIIPFKIPRKIDVYIDKNINNVKDIEQELLKYNYENKDGKLRNYHLNIFYDLNRDNRETIESMKNEENWKWNFCISLINNLLLELIKKPYTPNNSKDNIQALSHCDVEFNEKSFGYSKKLLSEIKRKLEEYELIDSILIDSYINIIDYLESNYEKLSISFDPFYEYKQDMRITINLNDSNEQIFKEFFKLYEETCFNHRYLRFSWNLSSGENNLLSMYSKFFSILNKNMKVINNFETNNTECNNIIILIDEADMSFHPRWQQEYIKSITNFVKDIYKGCTIQIIITTHSPILLSDIPKSNVIFIKKEDGEVKIENNSKHSETFAANISTLFYDSFFMENGSIGELAKDKINELIKAFTPEVENDSKKVVYPTIKNILKLLNLKTSDEIYGLINIIGEPIIREKLKSMFKKCIDNDKDVKKEIIEKQIEDLQKKLKKFEDNE